MIKPRHLAGLLVLVAVGAAGCGSSSSSTSSTSGGSASASSGSATSASTSASSGTPFTVAFVGALSGPFAAYGKPQLLGTEAAANIANAHGGADGHKIVVKTYDDGGTPSQAATLVAQAIQGKADLIIDGTSGNETRAMTPAIDSAKIVSFSPAVVDEDVHATDKYPYQFFSNVEKNAYSLAEVQWLKQKGYTKVGVMYENDAAGTGLLQSFLPVAKQYGIDVVAQANYDPTALDDSVPWEKLNSTKRQADVFLDEGTAPALLDGRLKAGVTLPAIGDGSVAVGVVKPAALHNVFAYFYPLQIQSPATRTAAEAAFVSEINRLGDKNEFLYIGGQDSDAVLVTAAAANKAQSIDASAIKRAIEQLPATNYGGTGLPLQFSSTDHAGYPNNGTTPMKVEQLGTYTNGVWYPPSNG
jgi:branched-chain amino acid transport system substrate-binding protein